jgi:hypothetical protein
MATHAPPEAVPSQRRSPGEKVLVLYERGASGAAAVALARTLAESDRVALTVLSLVPKAASGSRCGGSATEFNQIVLESVAEELAEARALLGPWAAETRFELLVEGDDPPLAEWSAAAGFGLILLPARRWTLRRGRHPEAARLARGTGAEVRVVSPPSKP